MTPEEKQAHSRSLLKVEVVAATRFAPLQNVVTFIATYPRIIHAEVMTHGLFCRNAASSRAIPISTMIEKVQKDTFVPWHWLSNQRGMSGGEPLPEAQAAVCRERWVNDAMTACASAQFHAEHGLLKGLANRPLEPYSFIQTLITTRLEYLPHFFSLRAHPSAEAHFIDLANAIRDAVLSTTFKTNAHHLPFLTDEEQHKAVGPYSKALVSAVRCRRVSYFRLDTQAKHPEWDEDEKQGAEMGSARPMHASPFEHQALRAKTAEPALLAGRLALPGEKDLLFTQFRKNLEGEFINPLSNQETPTLLLLHKPT